MLPHDGKRKNVMQQLHSHVLSCPNFDGGFKEALIKAGKSQANR